MDLFKFFLLIIFYFSCINCSPVVIGAIVGGIATYLSSYIKIPCINKECCSSKRWLPFNDTKLIIELDSQLYGQPLVKQALRRHLIAHVRNTNPSNALLLSFNGTPGTGKNYVSNFIANSFYYEGLNSKYVKLFVASFHFPNKELIEEYKKDLRNIIIQTVKSCPQSLFIFDEAQHLPFTLLDVLKPFIDNHALLDGVDYRKAIFILLSNTGSREINNILQDTWDKGQSRDLIDYHKLQGRLEKAIYASPTDGLSGSKLIQHSLVSGYVPFFPLEKSHVRLCLEAILKSKNISLESDRIEQLISKVEFKETKGIYFAPNGCRRLHSLLELEDYNH